MIKFLQFSSIFMSIFKSSLSSQWSLVWLTSLWEQSHTKPKLWNYIALYKTDAKKSHTKLCTRLHWLERLGFSVNATMFKISEIYSTSLNAWSAPKQQKCTRIIGVFIKVTLVFIGLRIYNFSKSFKSLRKFNSLLSRKSRNFLAIKESFVKSETMESCSCYAPIKKPLSNLY